MTQTTLERCWTILDAEMDKLMVLARDHPEVLLYRGTCRGMALVLAEFMGPHFRTADEIAKESKRRYDARQTGQAYETPGLASLRFMPPPGDDKYAGAKGVSQARSNTAISKLTDKERDGIKNALAVPGMFTEAEIAKVYGITEEAVRAVVSDG